LKKLLPAMGFEPTIVELPWNPDELT